MKNTFGIDIIPENDELRIEVLKRYQILDTPPENAFDHIAQLAARIFNVPISLVSLVDAEQVYFKANVGMGNIRSTSRGVSLCSLAVLQPEVTVFENAHEESCLLANPLVAGEFGLKFYAGAPITTPDGFLIGTLCVVDKQPRTFSEKDRLVLQGLATLVMDDIELRLNAIQENKRHENIQLELAQSKQQMEDMVMNSTMGMNIFRGRELLIEMANQPMYDIWSRTTEEAHGRPLMEVFPELEGQPFPDALTGIFDTKTAVELLEIPVAIMTPDGEKNLYINAKYVPLLDIEGQVESLVATIIDITDLVTSRKLLEESEEELQSMNEELTTTIEELAVINEELTATNEELHLTKLDLEESIRIVAENRRELLKSEAMLRLSTTAAEVHTWEVNLNTNDFISSANLKELLGYFPADAMSLASMNAQIIAAHQQRVIDEFQLALKQTQKFDVEYMIMRAIDGESRWLRAKGKVLCDSKGTPTHFAGVIIDITDKKEDEIRKNDFIAMVSHELKTPLTSLKGYLQLMALKNRKSEDAFVTNALAKGELQLQKMLAIIDGFLNVSEMDAGKIVLHKTIFNLDELVSEIADDMQQTNASHNIIIKSCAAATIHADRNKIAQVINNFLSNAVKYSPAGKIIEVICEQISGDIKLSVKDEGPGIEAHDRVRLFDRFYRVDNAEAKTISGFGIGLYICAEIIHRHEGEIWVESEIGNGSVFCFTLPIHSS